jgi:uncharacterized membrane protein YkoI
VTFQLVVLKIHKWVGLILGIQILLWILGGLIMSAFPLSRVHGDHTRAFIDRSPLNFKEVYPLARVLPSVRSPIESVSLENGDRGLVYNVKIQQWRSLYYDAITGKQLPPITQQEAETIAAKNYRGSALINNAGFIEDSGGEYKGIVPAWRIEFDDRESTTFYIEADSGKISASRNTMWRVYDFMWMLHIMDYEEREDFNHPLLIIFAASSLFFVVTGIILLFQAQYLSDLKRFFFSKAKRTQ